MLSLSLSFRTYAVINVEFESALLHGFLDAFAVAGVSGPARASLPVLHEAAHLVVPSGVAAVPVRPAHWSNTLWPENRQFKHSNVTSNSNA